MDRPPIRFRLRDALILIAATAAGFGMARAVWVEHERWRAYPSTTPWFNFWRFDTAMTAISAFVACLGLGVLVASVISDRRSFRRKLAAPGIIPPLVQFLSSAYSAACWAPTWVWMATGHPTNAMGWIDIQQVVRGLISGGPGTCVAIAWIIQAANGRFRPEPTWLDRSGRAIGVYWIGYSLVWINVTTFYFQ